MHKLFLCPGPQNSESRIPRDGDIIRKSVLASTWDDQATTFESSEGILNRIWELCRYSIKTAMLIATERFLVKHGLLTGEPIFQAPAIGEKFVPAPENK